MSTVLTVLAVIATSVGLLAPPKLVSSQAGGGRLVSPAELALGMRASVTYFVARHLGYDSRLYDGSIVDWTRRKLPAKTGR